MDVGLRSCTRRGVSGLGRFDSMFNVAATAEVLALTLHNAITLEAVLIYFII